MSQPTPGASDLARTELLRAVRRVRPQAAHRARAVLDSLVVLRLGTGIFEEATRLLGYPSPAPGTDKDAVERSVATALGIELVVDLDTDAREEQVARPLELTERYCSVGRTLADPPPVRVRRG